MKNGWQAKKLADICTLINGRAYSKPELLAEGKYPVLRVGNFFTNNHWYYSIWNWNQTNTAIVETCSTRGPPLSAPRIWTGDKVIFHYHIWKVQPDLALDRQEIPVFMWFLWDTERIKEDQGTGTTMIHVAKGSMEDRDIRVPSLPEQRRIVGILDEAFAGIAVAKANAEKNLQYARALFESHLNFVFTEPGEGWPIRRLGELCEQITDGTHNSPPYVDAGIPMLDSKHVREGFVIDDSEPEKFISPATDAMLAKRCKPRAGDILMSSRGSIGKIAIVRDGQDFNIMGNMILIRLPAEVSRQYAAFCLHSRLTHIESIARGVAQKGLYLNQVREYEIPIPGKKTQAQIGGQLKVLLSETQRLESIYRRKIAALEALKKSLLHQAFTGEL